MSGFSAIAMPGKMPTSGMGRSDVSPEALFRTSAEKAEYQRIIDGAGMPASVRVDKVKVEIFDMSDPKQVRKYEKLWKSLLEKSARMEVIVDHCKNLVQRADGTSYWMKYVEYVEFSEGRGRNEDARSVK